MPPEAVPNKARMAGPTRMIRPSWPRQSLEISFKYQCGANKSDLHRFQKADTVKENVPDRNEMATGSVGFAPWLGATGGPPIHNENSSISQDRAKSKE